MEKTALMADDVATMLKLSRPVLEEQSLEECLISCPLTGVGKYTSFICDPGGGGLAFLRQVAAF